MFAAALIPFSHRQHASRKVECVSCHPNAGGGSRMGTIGAQGCANCHRTAGLPATPALQRIDESARRGRAIRWERVHELPRWVWFSHGRHRKTTCATCHGQVAQRDLAEEEVTINMQFCRDCHLANNARAVCGTCHNEKK